MSPTIFLDGSYRYFFFAREEARMHVHVFHPDGVAKFWIEPEVKLARANGLSARQLREAETFITDHQGEIAHEWRKYFSP